MRKMLQRRTFLKRVGLGLASVYCAPAINARSVEAQANAFGQNRNALGFDMISPSRALNGDHKLSLYDLTSANAKHIPLPGRAHEVLVHPHQNVLIVLSRRPGTFIEVFDASSATPMYSLQTEANRHLYGHGLITSCGLYLITTEADLDSGEGRIVVRDTQDHYSVKADFPSYGIGPHQIKLLPDNDTLVVANGGIQTDPKRGRQKLNLDTMSPSLDYLSINSGKHIASYRLPEDLHQLSVRHIDVNEEGLVVIAMQYEGNPLDDVPLVATHRLGEEIHIAENTGAIFSRMKQYCGSVCFDQSGRYFCVSSPRGNLASFWDTAMKSCIASTRIRDVCGIGSPKRGSFTLSSGAGKVYHYALNDSPRLTKTFEAPVAFDNHLVSL